MLVLFNTEVHYVIDMHYLVEPLITSSGKKRKRSSSVDKIYILVNCKDEESIKEQFAVNADHCTELNVSINIEDSLATFIEHNLSTNTSSDIIRWTVSYRVSDKKEYKEYKIRSIHSILKDSIVIETREGEIRRFKFDKLVERCGEGITYI